MSEPNVQQSKQSAFVLWMRPGKKSVVAEGLESDTAIIGWSRCPEFAQRKTSFEEIKRILAEKYPDLYADDRHSLGQAAGSLDRFCNQMRVGDIVVVPVRDEEVLERGFLLGGIKSGVRHDSSRQRTDTANFRDVQWLNGKRPYPDSAASPTLLAKMKTRHTCLDITASLPEIVAITGRKPSEEGGTPRHDRARGTMQLFKPEFSSQRSPYAREDTIIASASHGKIVNCLAKLCEDQGMLVENSQQIDLLANAPGCDSLLFEAKTSADTQSIYTAVGQLMIHGFTRRDCRRVLVLPKGFMRKPWQLAFQSLGIAILTFALHRDGKVEFDPAEVRSLTHPGSKE